MAYNNAAKEALRALIDAELRTEFGVPELPANLDKYSNAMARAIATHFEILGYYPKTTDDYPPAAP